jgi:hypothetical protein
MGIMAASQRLFRTLREFYAADERRRDSNESDHGHWWSSQNRASFRVTRIHTTGEVIAVAHGGRASGRPTVVDYSTSNPFHVADEGDDLPNDLNDGPVEVLGQLSDDELMRALLWYPRRSSPPSFEEVRERLLRAPETPAGRAAAIRRWRETLAVEAAEADAERRASYEVISLAALPDDGVDHPAACGCDFCVSDWPLIADAAVTALTSGIDPLDLEAIEVQVAADVADDRDRSFVLSLFYDPIVVAPGDEFFTNGRHRTYAMRRHGVSRAVIYTAAGEELGR